MAKIVLSIEEQEIQEIIDKFEPWNYGSEGAAIVFDVRNLLDSIIKGKISVPKFKHQMIKLCQKYGVNPMTLPLWPMLFDY